MREIGPQRAPTHCVEGVFMIPRSILAFCIAILFSSAPSWASPMKSKSTGGSFNELHFNFSSNKSFHSNIKFLGGFKSESKKHDGFSNFHEDHFVLVVPFGTDSQGSNDGPSDSRGSNDGPSSDPVSTPEPGALTLLLAGALGLGALAYRRRACLVAAR